MSVKYTATWTCDGCETEKVMRKDSLAYPPPTWVTATKDKPIKNSKFTTAVQRHYCAKCAKEKGL